MNTREKLKTLFVPIESPLTEVRTRIQRIWMEALTLVHADVDAPSAPSGKLLRPGLCLLSAGAVGAPDLSRYVAMATAFEALHVASLAHDDVIDHAILRRGAASLNTLWDNHAAVLGGDYLVARAVELLAEYDSCPLIANAITSVRRMSEGELFFFGRDAASITVEDCLMLAEQKTASLFAEACSGPAMIVAPQLRTALHGYGIALGIAFQIVDDLLDIAQTTTTLGKPACGDIVEGKNTLPLRFMREAMTAEECALLDAMRNAELTDADRGWAQEKLQSTGAYKRTKTMAQRYADQARHHLKTLPATPYRDTMDALVSFILARSF